MRTLVALSALVLALVPVAAADDPDLDRVSVGESVGAVGRGYSRALFVTVPVEQGYTKITRASDGNSGHWIGPPYYAPQAPVANSDAVAKIRWRVAIAQGVSLRAAIDAHLVHKWPAVEQAPVSVEHITAGDVVGSAEGLVVLTKDPAPNSAQYESGVAFPLCGKSAAVASFEAVEPPSDNATRGRYAVTFGGAEYFAPDWNRDHAREAAKGVGLLGFLPPGGISAGARRHVISGRAWDCARRPLAHLRVRVGRRGVTTDASGRFRLRVRARGTYRVTAAVAGQAKATTVRVS